MFLFFQKLRFEFAFLPITEKESFMVEMFSLPPPTKQEEENGLFERRIISTPGYFSEIWVFFNLNIFCLA
jgi:hypothetical protein